MTTGKEFPMLTARRFRCLTLLLLLAWGGLLQPVAAQQPVPSVEDAKQVLRDAHAKSREANTLEQYNEILRLCQQASTMPLTDSLIEYERTLRSWAHNQRGEHYAEQAATLAKAGRNDAAAKLDAQGLREFETAIQLNPDYWKAIHNRGVSRAVSRQFDLALEDFSRVVELKPDYIHAWFNRGEIHYEQGRFEEAASDYGQAIELSPEDADLHARRGHARFQFREFRQALADYERAVSLSPQNVEFLVSRGDANRRLGRWQAAADDYMQAIKLDAKSGPAYQAAAWLMATCPDSKMRNTDLALRAAQQARELLGRRDYRALSTMAAALANAEDYSQAVATQTEALEVAPPEESQDAQKRLELYQQQRPYREQ
jgi:tetratricopeptide (TPR) repeat protein